MRSDEIESSAEIRQRSLRIDPGDDTPDAKELVVAGLAATDGKNQIYVITLQ